MKWPLVRSTFIRGDFFGMDSLQGLLELASRYEGVDAPPGYVMFCAVRGEEKHPDSFFSTIVRLQNEGYLQAEWVPSEDNSYLQLHRLTLTIAGHKLLAELKEKSAAGRFKRRLSDLIWVIVVSILTTLVTLQVKGE
jgi:hypothetical protein